MNRVDHDGLVVFAISYDPVEVLADFAAEHGIAYRLLSDSGSQVIQQLGLVNRHIEQQQAHYDMPVAERHRLTPYPATFELDADGRVVRRRIEPSYRWRPSGTVLLADRLRAQDAPVVAQASSPEITATAWLHTDSYRPQQLLEAHVALTVRDGLHVYVEPVPAGFTPLTLSLSGAQHLVAERSVLPQGRPWKVEGFDESFSVVEAEVSAAIRFRISADDGDVELTLDVAYQACSDRECFPPTTLSLRLPLRAGKLLRPG